MSLVANTWTIQSARFYGVDLSSLEEVSPEETARLVGQLEPILSKNDHFAREAEQVIDSIGGIDLGNSLSEITENIKIIINNIFNEAQEFIPKVADCVEKVEGGFNRAKSWIAKIMSWISKEPGVIVAGLLGVVGISIVGPAVVSTLKIMAVTGVVATTLSLLFRFIF